MDQNSDIEKMEALRVTLNSRNLNIKLFITGTVFFALAIFVSEAYQLVVVMAAFVIMVIGMGLIISVGFYKCPFCGKNFFTKWPSLSGPG